MCPLLGVHSIIENIFEKQIVTVKSGVITNIPDIVINGFIQDEINDGDKDDKSLLCLFIIFIILIITFACLGFLFKKK